MLEANTELLNNDTKLIVNNKAGGNGTCTTVSKSEEPEERETWGKKADFLLSVIGFAVDLGNIWRFPYICYRNGGGAFLIPYIIMLVFAGLPLFYMELALGQFQRCGMISVWGRICPMFTGIGYGIIFIATFVSMFYNTVIAWALFYTIACFRSEVPWASCNNEWNTDNCSSVYDRINNGSNVTINFNETVSSSQEYFLCNQFLAFDHCFREAETPCTRIPVKDGSKPNPVEKCVIKRGVLEMHRSDGIGDIGPVKWSIALCLLAVYLIIYFSLWKGIKSSGKAVWVTATLPYIVLFILLIRGSTLPGALDGVIFFLYPQWDRLLHVGVWVDAAAQIFFSLGPGFGTLLALSSYNKFNNNCYLDAIVTATINCLTSLLSGFVVFTVLGYMAFMMKTDVANVAIDGPGLVFLAYPEAIASLDGSVFWAIIFFLMLITLGLDSSFGGLEAVITGVCDQYPWIKRKREIFVGVLLIYCFLGGLSTTTYGGQYVITLLDTHGAPISILFICLMEAIAVNWFYGVQRFSDDLHSMLGFQPGMFWKICWAGICPIFLLILFILSCWGYSGMRLGDFVFPQWSVALGWCVTCISIMCVPAYIVYMFIVTPGNIRQKLRAMVYPDGVARSKVSRRNYKFNGIVLSYNNEPIAATNV